MDVVHERCAGIDIGKADVKVCIRVPGPGKRRRKEVRKHGLYDDPVLLLNTAGFRDGLILQLRRMDEQGLLPLPLGELVFVADTAAGALAYAEKCVERMARS